MPADKTALFAARCGILSAVALLFSFLETLIPVNTLIPLPGFKLGLGNIVVMLAVFDFGIFEAVVIAVVKVIVSSLLFGSPVSFVFSLFGACLSVAGLACIKRFAASKFSFVGVSVISAALHNAGQILAAAVFFGKGVFGYFPLILTASVIFGVLSGALICLVHPKIFKASGV